MTTYVGLDVSLDETAICVVGEDGKVLTERKVPSTPDAIAAFIADRASEVARVGLETGSLSVWLHGELRARGLPVICIDARHAKAALSMRINKTDRNDAAGLAQVMRTGWYREAHVKSGPSHLARALLASRALLVGMRGDIANQIRGLLKTFGVIVGKPKGGFRKKAGEVTAVDLAESPELARLVETLLTARDEVSRQVAALDREVMRMARGNEACKRFMTAPGVGGVVALSVWAAIDEPARFRCSTRVGAYFGLTPRRYASGEVDRTGRVSKCGDKGVRTHLYEAANVILTRIRRPSALQVWGLDLARRSGFRKAKVAVARKLAVILHRMWRDGTEFRPAGAASAMA
ncbi:IS110 family transposase [Roseomonas mucosa]|uniref:IS110 family transposase n=1 Tax=Roseomonas mucosa TaxID=207340 RepID=UPI0028CCACFD|nr:IS110 family transposase [Roseomonas mucosa]MDT8278700.1 IS110 family transposase [Roseomonas mucosa]